MKLEYLTIEEREKLWQEDPEAYAQLAAEYLPQPLQMIRATNGQRDAVDKIVIQNPTLRPVSEQTPYMENINKPPTFKGYSRATGEALCEFKFNCLTEEFEWFTLVPEEKWNAEEAASVCRYLAHLNTNREELTRGIRIRQSIG